jgi:DNA-binding PucR family transcriptional regulator
MKPLGSKMGDYYQLIDSDRNSVISSSAYDYEDSTIDVDQRHALLIAALPEILERLRRLADVAEGSEAAEARKFLEELDRKAGVP